MASTNKVNSLFVWIFRLIAAIIMLQTLYFKFSAAEESVYIFTTIGMEPWGRIGIGVMELVASVLLLIPFTSVIGAGLGIGLMLGAMFFHLTKLGIDVMNDGGQLFYLALTTTICCVMVLILDRSSILNWIARGTALIKKK